MQEGRNASPAMNDVFLETIIKVRFASQQAALSVHVDSESRSTEIDENDSQPEKHDEERI
jgi:subtilase family serine protease